MDAGSQPVLINIPTLRLIKPTRGGGGGGGGVTHHMTGYPPVSVRKSVQKVYFKTSASSTFPLKSGGVIFFHCPSPFRVTK